MKKCPYCAEEIQDAAIKWRHCGEWFEKKEVRTLNIGRSSFNTIREEVLDNF